MKTTGVIKQQESHAIHKNNARSLINIMCGIVRSVQNNPVLSCRKP